MNRKRSRCPIATIFTLLWSLSDVALGINGDGPFEAEARQRLPGRDEDDWPVLATALGRARYGPKTRTFLEPE